MNYETTVARNQGGKLQAKTVIDLGADNREMHVVTDKAYRKGIDCTATVYTITMDGRGLQHIFGLGKGGDFSATLASDVSKIATEKNLRTMHAAALEGIEDVLAKARAHYALGKDKA